VRAGLLAALCACALAARAAPAGLVIEAEVVPTRVYVGAEALLRLRLLRAPGVPVGALRAPDLGDAAEVRPLGATRWSETQRDGVTWQVHERTHLIVPRRAGRLIVPGVELDGALEAGAVRGPQRVLEVRPPPAAAGEPWLPARSMVLEESWSRDPAALSAGTPVTRTLVLRAEGIAAQRLPRLEMAAHPLLGVHHDQPELADEYLAAGVAGRRVQRVVLVPLEEGEVVLPAVSVRWWHVGADAPRTATLAGRALRLQAASAPAALPEAPPVSPLAMLRAGAAAVALLLAALLWWRARTELLREARRQLRAACRGNNPHAGRDALIKWREAVAPGAPLPLVRRIGAEWDAGGRAQLAALDAALYGGRAWDGKAFWRRVRPSLRRTAAQRAAPAALLPPFFRLQEREATRP